MAGGSGIGPQDPALDAPPALASVPAAATGALVIDLAAVQRNYRKLAAAAAPAECAAVIKADAYGLGAGKVAPALAACGCRTFFVATLQEAAALRPAAPGAAIYVLDGLFPGAAPDFAAIQARPALGSMAEIEEWAAARYGGAGFPSAALHLDTGMNRLGVKPAGHDTLIAAPDLIRAAGAELAMSHLACADTPDHPKNAAQLAAFRKLTSQLPAMRRSLANSAGIFLSSDYAFDLVRPGIALYGGNPFAQRPNPMEPVIRLFGRIAQSGEAERGETVGYGAARTLARRTRYIAVTVGYADGYVRALGSSDVADGAIAWLGDTPLPILGRVSMDLIVLDVTDIPAGRARRGGFVELIGPRFTIDEAARLAGTIGYEVLTSLGSRYARIYTGPENGEDSASASLGGIR
jgi:alanine racemase